MDIRAFEVTEVILTHHLYDSFVTTDLEVFTKKGEAITIQLFGDKGIDITISKSCDHRKTKETV